MKKIEHSQKANIYGGLSFWTFAMGTALLFNTAVQGISALINAAKNQYDNSSQNNNQNNNFKNNNSWSSGYNRLPDGSSMMLRFGLLPGKSSMIVNV